ncbi:transporter substrate-binding domain-containing protein [Parasporobacterium paucivorans]|uniref:Putative lysine transport system substrate-binding protein n=1 Tax=Parasporobacterium paucivorans DSM 15970 TaxID=1122934 RepID=A0A1M6FRN9_9FIRM|nr:transporter substrate-binding domain-containing protein [Parasporobacterium paucivorans]SHJ00398.1 putative lysine transport system substrate-binding protein [Parasporobacterium paucivorans DSM 15970]
MKKIITALLLVTTLLTLGACGNSSASGSNETTSTASGKDRPVLRVGMECAYAPYNWAQSDDSNGAVPIVDSSNYAYGYDVMMAKYIADYIGYDLEIYKIDWDSLPLAVQSGTIDCVIAGQSITAERQQTVDFSTPYYYASIVALTTKDSPYASAKGLSDLAGATCTSQLSTVWYNDCLPQIKDANILAAMESAPAMMTALDSGKVNLVVTDMPTALAALQVYDNFTLLDFNQTDDNFSVSDEEINIGISLKKGNSELLGLINGALATLTEDDFKTMMEEAISVQPLSE